MSWDPFAVLGLPRSFALDRADIERAYLARVAAAHPDAADPNPPTDAAALNRARQELSDPESRANTLLRLLGGPSKEADRALPDGFLMQIMDIRAAMEADVAAGVPIVDKWGGWADVQRADHIRHAAALFAQIERDGGTPQLFKVVRTRLNAWRYIERMLEQVIGSGHGPRGPGAR